MKKHQLLTILLIVLINGSTAFSDDYAINITRKNRNVYKVDGKDIYINTQMCLELALSEKAFLSMNGFTGQITFIRSGKKYLVKSVVGKINQDPGDYKIRINQENQDTYSIYGTDLLIITDGCNGMALYKEVILSINAYGSGDIIIDGRKCMVLGIYEKMRL